MVVQEWAASGGWVGEAVLLTTGEVVFILDRRANFHKYAAVKKIVQVRPRQHSMGRQVVMQSESSRNGQMKMRLLAVLEHPELADFEINEQALYKSQSRPAGSISMLQDTGRATAIERVQVILQAKVRNCSETWDCRAGVFR